MTKFKMNRTQFMLLTALNMLGSGILMLPAKVAQVGGIGLLSWFVVCLAAVAMAYAFANCGIYSKYRLGGLGAIAENAFGMPGSFLTNYIYAFSVVIANVAIATLKTVESTLSQIRRRRARGTSGLWPSSP